MNPKNFFLSLFLIVMIQLSPGKLTVSAQSFEVDTILYNGDPDKFINFVFMGDGYQASQLSNYNTDVENVVNYLFSISPYAAYQDYFNVFTISVPSAQSGADHPGTTAECGSHPPLTVDTYFNSTFDYFNIHRLLVPQNLSAINSVIFSNFPLYDQPLILVNTPYYGGSGGNTATSSLHSSGYEIMIHEIGHSFVDLADEYFAGIAYAAEKPNMTQETDPELVKWKNWLGTDGVGIYTYGGAGASWYRPHNGCKMRYLGPEYPFCPVCKEAIVERVHTLFGTPVISYNPDETETAYCSEPLSFDISTIKPIPNTLKMKWELNNNVIAQNVESVLITSSQLNAGTNTLTVQVQDTTSFIRDSLHTADQLQTIAWTINYEAVSTPVIEPDGVTTFCQGELVILTASESTAYLWSNGATTQSIAVSESGNYAVTVTDENGCAATSLPETVDVIPVNTSVSFEDFTLTANADDAQYQWVTCTEPFEPIEGETNQTFTAPEEGGTYAVIVTENGCTDISECFQISITGLGSVTNSANVVVFPNPTHDLLTVKGTGLLNDKYTLTLLSASGQKMREHTRDVSNGEIEEQVDMREFASGLYLISIKSQSFNRVFKVQKL